MSEVPLKGLECYGPRIPLIRTGTAQQSDTEMAQMPETGFHPDESSS